MTEDHYKRLVAMLLDTVQMQQNRIQELEKQLAKREYSE